jgi:tetratricopeptide (TPR) repeat protein
MKTTSLLAASLAASLAWAAPARAQLGLDLGPEEGKGTETPAQKKPVHRKKPHRRMPEARPPQAAPEPAKSAPEPAPRAQEPVTLPGLEIGAKAKSGEGAARLAAAGKVFAAGDYETAALAYDAILRDPAFAEAHDEARYQETKALVKLGLYHSALARLDEILSKGPQGSPHYRDALEWLFHVGRKTVNEAVIVSQVARYSNGLFPASARDEFTYLLARYAYERGQALDEAGRQAEARRSYDEAQRLTSEVRPEAGATVRKDAGEEGDVYARARFVDGLVRYATGDGQGAVESFKDVVRLTNPKRGRAPDLRIRELAFLQLARIHYEHRQNRYAIFYYDKMPWGGDSWLEGLWESSYAHYRIGNYEKALGNLLTLQSPYFREEWFPESWILKAIIYYENCRYPEARAILDEFHWRYGPAHDELERMTGKGAPAEFYDLIEDAAKGRGAGAKPMMRRIMKLAFTDANIKRLNDSILETEKEMDEGLGRRREAFRSSALAKELRGRLETDRKKLVEEAGARARQKLEYERDALRDLLEKALRIKIEVSRKEREALEKTLSKGGPVDVLRNYRYSVAVSDDHLYWPYDGEFWRDELGTYTYTLTKGCRDASVRADR